MKGCRGTAADRVSQNDCPVQRAALETWTLLYCAEALAERKRVRELLTQSWELLKQMQAS